jgi:1-pyrroline-5-carboxylate dehydrogenase
MYVLQQHYTKGSVDRKKLQDAIAALKKKGAVQVPLAIGGEHVSLALSIFSYWC